MTSVAARSPTVCGTKKRGRGGHSDYESDEVHSPQGKRHRALFGLPGVHALPSPSRGATSLQRLLRQFPSMDPQVVSSSLEDCDGDIEAALKQLTELSLARSSTPELEAPPGAPPASPPQVPASRVDDLDTWSEALCNELAAAQDVTDAKGRAKKFLANCKAHIESCEGAKYAANVEQVTRENGVLKRAVAIQHARMSAAGDKDQQIQQLQEMLAQYQERLRTLELSNYSLSLHLKQATGACAHMDRGPPDIY